MRGARELIVAAALGAAAVTACAEAESPVAERAAATRAAPSAGSPSLRRPQPLRVARPARLVIPSLGVSTRLETLGLLADGRLAPPRDPDRAGWWRGGPRPGRPGAAVIAGHVDSRSGPAVFARLGRLRRGDRIVVVDRAGRAIPFSVIRTEEHAKDRFPTQRVYGRTQGRALRLITCSGAFDRASGHYRSNVVVFAAHQPAT